MAQRNTPRAGATGATGAQALKPVWAVLLRTFPDLHVAVEDVIADGDRAVFRNTVTGTHLGEYKGPMAARPARAARERGL
ncbi:ester cyclase [Streptomyces sp. ISL-36]|uniref:ester cyclase n=1 Tax=Streptomyces sp. ISL-36 TaxID=2819182 RepID=UPI0035A82F53